MAISTQIDLAGRQIADGDLERTWAFIRQPHVMAAGVSCAFQLAAAKLTPWLSSSDLGLTLGFTLATTAMCEMGGRLLRRQQERAVGKKAIETRPTINMPENSPSLKLLAEEFFQNSFRSAAFIFGTGSALACAFGTNPVEHAGPFLLMAPMLAWCASASMRWRKVLKDVWKIDDKKRPVYRVVFEKPTLPLHWKPDYIALKNVTSSPSAPISIAVRGSGLFAQAKKPSRAQRRRQPNRLSCFSFGETRKL
jgi:hypothetical protein